MVRVNGSLEGGDGGWNLETVEQDFLLSLEENVFGPLDDSGQISFGSDGVADLEVAWVGLKQRVPGSILLRFASGLLNLSSLFLK